MHSFIQAAFLSALSIHFANAQTPPFNSPVSLQPGNFGGQCLAAQANYNGAPVTLQKCNGDASQLWTFTGGAVKIYGNMCLDVTDGSTADGKKLQIWQCFSGNTNQQFYYTGDKRLAWTNHGKCVDLTDGKGTNGNPIQSWTCTDFNANQVWDVGYYYSKPPTTSQQGQSGGNNCGTTSNATSNCQTAWINDVDDFCLFGPGTNGSTVASAQRNAVAFCTKATHGSRTIPSGALTGVHFVKTGDYVQVTGRGDLTKINVKKGDTGGEFDPHNKSDGKEDPIGALVYGDSFTKGQQYHEWVMFMNDTVFCFRACTGASATSLCNSAYDQQGCLWNIPANYSAGTFESCKGKDDEPMGVYGSSTWVQGNGPAPTAHTAAPSSSCKTVTAVGVSTTASSKRSVRIPVDVQA